MNGIVDAIADLLPVYVVPSLLTAALLVPTSPRFSPAQELPRTDCPMGATRGNGWAFCVRGSS